MSQLQVTKITTVDNTTPLILATGNAGGGQIIVQSSNTDVFFNGNLRLSSLVTGDGSGLYLPSSNVANAAFNTANAAYASANNVAPQVTPAFNTANVAFDTANAAFASANNVAPQVEPSFRTANSAFATANIASNTAIAAYNGANAAYSQANAAYSHANTKFSSSGGSITGAVEISGDLTVRGNTRFIDQQTLAVGDSLIYLAANNYSSDVVDIGFVANYVNTGGSNVHTGLYRSSGNKEYYLFQGYDKEPYNNYIDPVGNNFTLAVLNADIITNNLFLGGANAINWITAAFAKANASGANVGQTAPTGVTSGKLWWNSDLGKLFVYYTDPANTSSWIETSPSASAIEGSIITGYINPVYNTVNAAYTSSNANYVVSNSAFAKANAALANTSGTFAGDLNVTGNVGIATTSTANSIFTIGGTLGAITTPARSVHVAHARGGALFLGKDNTNYSYLIHDADNSLSQWLYRGGSGVTLDSSGNVGVGITPNAKFQVKAATDQNFQVSGSISFSNSVCISGVNDLNNQNIPIEFRGAGFQWYNSGSFGMTLNSSGNLGIGTNSPGYLQHNYSGTENAIALALSSISNSSTAGSLGLTTKLRIGALGSANNNGVAEIRGLHNLYQNSLSTLTFLTNDGTSLAERMRIDSSGRVTKPYQPMFRAANSSTNITVTAGQEIMFNSVGYNVGSHYNSSTSRFTCPVSGYYLFSLHVFDNTNANIAERRYSFAVNGSGIGQWTKVDDTTKGGSHTSTLIQYLSAGDFVSVTTGYSSGVFFGGHSFFMGYLLG